MGRGGGRKEIKNVDLTSPHREKISVQRLCNLWFQRVYSLQLQEKNIKKRKYYELCGGIMRNDIVFQLTYMEFDNKICHLCINDPLRRRAIKP